MHYSLPLLWSDTRHHFCQDSSAAGVSFRSVDTGEVYHTAGHEAPEREQRHSSTLSLNPELDGDGWSTSGRRDRFTLGMTRYSLYNKLGGPHTLPGRVRQTPHALGFDARNVQPVANRCTCCAIPAHRSIDRTRKITTVYTHVDTGLLSFQ
jgi:hypothetical protein